MMPKGWSVNTLADAGVVVIDGDRGKEYPKSTEFYSSGYCVFLSAKNVSKGGFAFNEVQFIDEQKHLKLRKGLVNRGNIVLTTRGTVGQFAYFDDSVPYDVMRINSGMVVLDVDKSLFHGDFFYALCRSSIVNKQIEAASFGSAQPQLTVRIIKGLTLPIPPLPEQKKIAKILSTWDQAISTTEQLLANSQQQKKALMQQLLTGKKRLLDKNGVRFSGEWVAYHLNKIANVIVSPVDKKAEPDEIPVELCNYTDVYYNHLITNKISFMKATATKSEIEKYTLVKGDVIITKDSETPGDIAVPALVSEDLGGVVCGYHLAIVRPFSNYVDSSFLNYLFSMQKTRY
ncbi:MAG: restriction endonuclease subunit S, partial [Aeromonadaceae bacterium]